MYGRRKLAVIGLEIVGFFAALSCSGILWGDIYQDMICATTTLPVTTCGCPNAVEEDRCAGSLPKDGSHYYGNVQCAGSAGHECTSSDDNANPCGQVVHAPCITCTTPIIYYDPTDTVNNTSCAYTFYTSGMKPPCDTAWGNCGRYPNPTG